MFSRPPEKARFMTKDVFEKACREVGSRRNVSIEISAYGETFQHPQADNYLYMVRTLCPNASIVVSTNGTLLNSERCKKIVDSGIDHLSFSLDAGSKESYKWLTGVDDYDGVCRNLENLVNIRNQMGAKHLKITTHIIGIKELAHEFDSFIKRWENIVDLVNVRNYGNWGGLVNENSVTPAEKQEIPEERYPCAWLWYATKIEPNGDVSKCFIHVTGDKDPLGNIMDQSFESIWKGEKLRILREKHCLNKYNEIEFCENCIVWSLFPKFWYRKIGLINQERMWF
jgi:radical SAM protein with 4Fe4S-binding SPASM domain